MVKTMSKIGEAFSYVFRDPRWFPKLAMGALFTFLSIFLIGAPFIIGYTVRITRNVIHRKQYPLPEWTDFGAMFVTGLKLIVCYVLLFIPFIIIIVVPVFLFLYMGTEMQEFQFIPVFFILYVFMIVGGVFYSLFTIPITIRFAVTGKIRNTFDLGQVWHYMKNNFVNIILYIVIAWVANFIGSMGLIVLYIGVFFSQVYSMMVTSYLLGQIELAAQESDVGVVREPEKV